MAGWGGMNYAASIGVADGDCTGCADCGWCYTFDFSLGELGWYPAKSNTSYNVAAGVYVLGGWGVTLTVDGAGGYSYEEIIQLAFPYSSITSVEVVYDRTAGSYDASGYSRRISRDGKY